VAKFSVAIARMTSSPVLILCTLGLLAVTVTARSAINCLHLCNCRQLNANSILTDCEERTEMNGNLLGLCKELDLLLSDDELRGRLTSLRISNTSLTEVPLSVCLSTVEVNLSEFGS